jgi:hypothetical protein
MWSKTLQLLSVSAYSSAVRSCRAQNYILVGCYECVSCYVISMLRRVALVLEGDLHSLLLRLYA